MKRLRQICAVTVLTILLTNTAWAEEPGISHPWYVPPPPPTVTETTQDGAAPTGEATAKNEETTTDLATEITLILIQNMLALF